MLLLLACSLAASLALPVQFASGQTRDGNAQSQQIRFERVPLPDVVTSITSIAQDQDGFLWLGTWSGLYRYDGYDFTVYRHHPLDSTSISDDQVESLLVDRTGTLWVGIRQKSGLNRFDAATGTFTRYVHDPDDPHSLNDGQVSVLYEDRDGILWIGSQGGLSRFDPDTETFTRYMHDEDDPASLSHNEVRTLYEDRNGVLWIGTGSPWYSSPDEGGLNRFDRETETFTHFMHDPSDETSLLSNWVHSLFEDSRGTFWVGTSGYGLHTMDRDTGTFTRHRYDPDDPGKLSGPYLADPEPDIITFIFEDRNGVLWIGASDGGLNRYDPATGTLARFQHDPSNLTGLGSNSVWKIYESQDGVLWIGTLLGGLFKLDRSQFPLYTFDITGVIFHLLEDEAGQWLLGGVSGLHRFDPATGTYTSYQDGLPSLSGGEPILESRDGTVWLGSWLDGLYAFDPQTERFRGYLHDPADPTSLSHDLVSALYETRDGILWVGTWGGLNALNPQTGRFDHYLHDPANPNSLRYDQINVIYETRAGHLWIGTPEGLSRLDRATGLFTTYLDGTRILALHEDAQDALWIGTQGAGLYQMDGATGALTLFTTRDGLPDLSINGILEDHAGALWLRTGYGLSKFDPAMRRFHNFDVNDGLHANASSFGIVTRDGALVVGGANGYNTFYPDQIEEDFTPPRVALTDFRLSNQSVHPGPDGPLDQPISATEALVLDHTQKDLSFAYVALHYGNPARNQYAYRLEPYQDDWQMVGTQRTAGFTNLDSGEYVFRVKAANSDGVWNEEGTSVRITILPPWWRTWWAYVLYGLIFAAGVFAVDRFQRRRLIRKERERARERELEQAREIEKAHTELQRTHQHLKTTQAQLVQQEKMASLGALTAGIAHEIKNPLNFINNFAEVNEELADELRQAYEANPEIKLADLLDVLDYLKQNAQVINQHGKRVDGIVHAMMQHASSGSGEREPTDVNALLEEYVNLAYHGKRAQTPGFNVEIDRDYDEGVGTVSMVPQEIGRVLLNLLSNAFDAVQEKTVPVNGAYAPVVKVSTSRTNEGVTIRIADNGPGIPDAVRDHIFEPFFTTKPTGTGTGLGLSLAYDIVTQGHGGALEVESEEGKGATFIITLPTRGASRMT